MQGYGQQGYPQPLMPQGNPYSAQKNNTGLIVGIILAIGFFIILGIIGAVMKSHGILGTDSSASTKVDLLAENNWVETYSNSYLVPEPGNKFRYYKDKGVYDNYEYEGQYKFLKGEDAYKYLTEDLGRYGVTKEELDEKFALYDKYLVLDSWTSASQRGLLVYDIENASKVFETDYYPWEYWLVLNDNVVTFYKKIDDSMLLNYTLPQCKNEYDNGYIEKYGYTLWEDKDDDLWDVQCAYFE